MGKQDWESWRACERRCETLESDNQEMQQRIIDLERELRIATIVARNPPTSDEQRIKGIVSDYETIIAVKDAELEQLKAQRDQYEECLPMSVLNGTAEAQLISGEHVETAEALNVLVGATIFVRDSLNPADSVKVFKYDHFVFPGKGAELQSTVLDYQLPMLLSGQPTPADFAGSPPYGMSNERIGAAFHVLGNARLVSWAEYVNERRDLWHEYFETLDLSKAPAGKGNAQRTFYEFFDGTFNNWEKRAKTIKQQFQTFGKSPKTRG